MISLAFELSELLFLYNVELAINKLIKGMHEHPFTKDVLADLTLQELLIRIVRLKQQIYR
jgi:hypothetical protein